MKATLRDSLSRLLTDERGATATEYAVIITILILAVIATILVLANWDGDGLTQQAFSTVSNKVGTFGRIE
jgi:Flp pilus assembly pilin Flp